MRGQIAITPLPGSGPQTAASMDEWMSRGLGWSAPHRLRTMDWAFKVRYYPIAHTEIQSRGCASRVCTKLRTASRHLTSGSLYVVCCWHLQAEPLVQTFRPSTDGTTLCAAHSPDETAKMVLSFALPIWPTLLLLPRVSGPALFDWTPPGSADVSWRRHRAHGSFEW